MNELGLKSYKMMIDQGPNMVWRSNTDAKHDFFNKTWLDFTGKTFEEEYGDGWLNGIHPDDLNRYLETYLDRFHKRLPFEIEYRFRRHDAKWRKINNRGVPYFSESNEFLGYIGSCIDVTNKVEGKILKNNIEDSLTKIYNRQHLEKLLQDELEKATRDLTIIKIDIDNFKKINDTYGHIKGDQLLKNLAEIIKDKLQKGNFFGRYGGDEFIIGFPKTNVKDTLQIAEKIRKAISKNSIIIQEKDLRLTVSIGISILTSEKTVSELIKKADEAMIAAKKSGGNKTLTNPVLTKTTFE